MEYRPAARSGKKAQPASPADSGRGGFSLKEDEMQRKGRLARTDVAGAGGKSRMR